MKNPVSSTTTLFFDDMPEEVKRILFEAREIIVASQRSVKALLRLAAQKLIWHLGEGDEFIDLDINNLKKKELELIS